MAANIDVSTMEDSTNRAAPRTPTQPGKSRLEDAIVDVTAEIEIEPALSVASRSRLRMSRRDQLSLLSALLILTAVFFFTQFFGRSSAQQPQHLTGYQIDLNSAGLEELVLLEGIGELMAEKIILDRELNGPFPAEEQLQRVKGIGPKTIERLRAHVVCR